jgi:hypothetical protein
MNRAIKGELTLETAIRMLLFAIVLVLFVVPIVLKLYDLLAGTARPGTVSSMILLSKEIKYLEGETLVPVFVDDKYQIRGYDAEDPGKPERCDRALSCLCTYKVEAGSSANLQQCVDLEYEAGSKKLRVSSIEINPTDKVTNFLVKLSGDTITVEPRPGIAAK